MSETEPAPRPMEAPKNWEVSAPEPAPAAPTTARAPSSEQEMWIERVSFTRGRPGLAAIGWAVLMLGLIVLAYSYIRTFTDDATYAPSGLRADYAGIVLAVVGLALAIVFSFVPARRPTGFRADAPADEIAAEARFLQSQLLIDRVLTGVGLALMALGLVWITYWYRLAYLDDAGAIRDTMIAGRAIPSHYVGAAIAVIGFLLVLAFWLPTIPGRHARTAVVRSMVRSGPAPTPPGAAQAQAAAASPEELQRLMKRIDSLMAQLPDSAVSEFSKTPEADTYLKLLGP